MNHLHILTLNWNGLTKISKLKESLMPSLDSIKYTWHIRDNGSTDASVEEINKWSSADKNIICHPLNHNNNNFSEGVNELFTLSNAKDSDLVLLLNNDVVFNDRKSLNTLISLMESDRSIGVVGAKLLKPNSDIINHAGVVFHPHNGLPMHFRAGDKDDKHSKVNREFQAVTGAVFLTRASTFKDAGCMNGALRWAFDDIHLALSIKYNLKKKIVMAGDVDISHEESASLKLNPVNKLHMNHNIKEFLSSWNKKYIIDFINYKTNSNCNIYKGPSK